SSAQKPVGCCVPSLSVQCSAPVIMNRICATVAPSRPMPVGAQDHRTSMRSVVDPNPLTNTEYMGIDSRPPAVPCGGPHERGLAVGTTSATPVTRNAVVTALEYPPSTPHHRVGNPCPAEGAAPVPEELTIDRARSEDVHAIVVLLAADPLGASRERPEDHEFLGHREIGRAHV